MSVDTNYNFLVGTLALTLLERLQHIRSAGEYNSNGGICLQLQLSPIDRGTLIHLMSLWPKYSGSSDYPIPSTKKGLLRADVIGSTIESIACGLTRTPTASYAMSCLTS